MRNLAAVELSELSGKFQRFKAIGRSLEMTVL